MELLVKSLVSNGALDNDKHATTVRAASTRAHTKRCQAESVRLMELAAGTPKVMRRA